MLLVDAANVVGSRPDGWWRDRPGAARGLVERVRAASAAGRLGAGGELVVVVVEGQARRGVRVGMIDDVLVLHAAGSGDDILAEVAADAAGGGGAVLLVSADRELRRRVEATGGAVTGPGWLLDRV